MQLEPTWVDQLADAARAVGLAPGQVLVEQGDEADEVFVVTSGELVATTATACGEIEVGRIGEQQVVGEITVIAGGRRTATLRAGVATEVLAVDRREFEQWLARTPGAADSISAQARERIDRSQIAALITQLVGRPDETMVQRVVERITWRRLGAGATLFSQGDEAAHAYVVVSGRVLVLGNDDGVERPVRELGRGEVVGELGLLDRAPRSATVRAIRDSTLAELSADDFHQLTAGSPELMLHVTRNILTRLRTTPRRVVDRAASLTFVVTAPVDGGALVESVADAVRGHGTVRHLSSRRVDEFLNRPGISQADADNVGVPRLSEFLHEADVGNDHLVLEADREMTAWTRRSLHHADRVIFVTSARPDGDERRRIRAVVDELAGAVHAPRMLVVHHPTGTARPTGTAAAAREVGADDIVHVRAGSSGDIERLARLASGRGVGLVLGGGGARGFAHLGAHRALLECGVPVDAVAGSSIGAPVGAAIAQGLVGEELLETGERQFHRLLDYTLPVVSLIKGERITRSIESTLGGWDIEDLWLPFSCVSTNLTTSESVVHDRGSLAFAVRASVAIPGVLPPVPFDGDLLVDGGVLDNLPVSVMQRAGTIGTIVAVDVAPPQGPRAKSDFGLSVSGLSAATARFRPGAPSYPNLSAILLRSMLTGSVRNQQAALAGDAVDLVLPLHLPGVGLLDFERVRSVAAAGYEAANAPIAAWAAGRPWMDGAS